MQESTWSYEHQQLAMRLLASQYVLVVIGVEQLGLSSRLLENCP